MYISTGTGETPTWHTDLDHYANIGIHSRRRRWELCAGRRATEAASNNAWYTWKSLPQDRGTHANKTVHGRDQIHTNWDLAELRLKREGHEKQKYWSFVWEQ
ncbi:hypothetical protein NQZ68_016468 [Dissostichus eleginoides]|nr:hypothetical protein NQZ68_016468 [Dissostichus eleginoides]